MLFFLLRYFSSILNFFYKVGYTLLIRNSSCYIDVTGKKNQVSLTFEEYESQNSRCGEETWVEAFGKFNLIFEVNSLTEGTVIRYLLSVFKEIHL